MKRVIKFFFHILIILSVASSIIFTQGCAKKESNIIKIGAILPLSGNLAFLGEGEKQGIELAVEFINQNGGINGKKMQVIFEDSKAEPKTAATIANKLLSVDKCQYVFVSTTACSYSVAPIVNQSNALLFAMTIDPEIVNQSDKIFRVWISDAEEWELAANYAIQHNFNKIGLIRVNNEYGIRAKQTLIKYLKGKADIVFDETAPLGSTDYRDILLKLKEKNVDALACMIYPKDLIALIKQMNELKINPVLLGTVNFSFDFVRKAVGKSVKRIIFGVPAFMLNLKTERGDKFVATFKEKYGKDPDWNAAYSYDNILVLAEAIKRAKSSDPQKVKKALLSIEEFPGVTGPITVHENGDTKTWLVLATYKNGEIVPLNMDNVANK